MSASLVVLRNADDALLVCTPLPDDALERLVLWLAGGEPAPGSWPPPCGWMGTDDALHARMARAAAEGWAPCLVVLLRQSGGVGVSYDAAAGPWHVFARDLLAGLAPPQAVLH